MKSHINRLGLVALLAVTAASSSGCFGTYEAAARLECTTDLTIGKEATAACKCGAKLARAMADEELHWYSSDSAARGLLRMAQDKCTGDKACGASPKQVMGCLTGIEKFKDSATSNQNSAYLLRQGKLDEALAALRAPSNDTDRKIQGGQIKGLSESLGGAQSLKASAAGAL